MEIFLSRLEKIFRQLERIFCLTFDIAKVRIFHDPHKFLNPKI